MASTDPSALDAERANLTRLVRTFASFLDAEARLPGVSSYLGVVDGVVASGAIGRLRLLREEFVGMLPAFSAGQLRALDERLRSEALVSVDELQHRHLEKIRHLQAAGRLKTEAQYHLVRERLEFIWHQPELAAETQALQRLLSDYEDRVAAKLAKGKSRTPAA